MPRIFPDYTPIALPREQSVLDNPPVYGSSPVFDFDIGEFKLNPAGSSAGALFKTTGINTLIEWIRKTLVTPRFKHGIYPDWYGSELENQIGGADMQHVGNLSLSSIGDIERNIKDALLVDRRIISVTDFASKFEGDRLITSFKVNSTLGTISNITATTELPQ